MKTEETTYILETFTARDLTIDDGFDERVPAGWYQVNEMTPDQIDLDKAKEICKAGDMRVIKQTVTREVVF